MSENMSEKTANKTYWWRFNHEHARHTRHFKPIYWGLFSVGGTIAALALAGAGVLALKRTRRA